MAAKTGAFSGQACVHVFLGHDIEEPTELRFLHKLRSDLEARGEPSLVLANFYCGAARTQIDFVVVTSRGATVVEVKGYRLPVDGGVNGPWTGTLPGNRQRTIASKNPFQQGLDARHAIVDELSRQQAIDSVRAKQAVGGNLCLFPEPLEGSSIPAGNFKCTVGGYRELLSQIGNSRPNPGPLEMWRSFASRIGLVAQTDDVPSPASRFATEYASQWQATMAAASKPFVPLPLLTNGQETSLAQNIDKIREGSNLIVVGGSGSGKSRVLEELSSLTASAGMLPMAIEARIFEGNLRPLLERSVALSTNYSLANVLRCSRRTANAAVVFVDGFNECPDIHQKSLVRALFALHRRYRVQVVLTSQTEVPVPWLPNNVVKVPDPSAQHLRAVLEAHFGRVAEDVELGALEVAATAHDAEILAHVMLGESYLDGRFSLYSAFTHQRLGSQAALCHGALAKLAGRMRERFFSSVSEHELLRELTVILDSATAAGQAWDMARQCGLMVLRSGKAFFRHDLLADYFSTVSLMDECSDAQSLARALVRPINAPLVEFAVGGIGGISDLEALLGSPPTDLLIACIDGKCGSKAKSFVLDRMHDMLDSIVADYKQLELELVTNEDGRHHVNVRISDGAEPRSYGGYLSVVPHALGHGLLPDVMDAFGRIDRHILKEAEHLRTQHPDLKIAFRRRAYNAVYSSPGNLILGAMLEIQQGFMSLRRPAYSDGLNRTLWDKLATSETFRPGQLLILLGFITRLEPLAECIPHDFAEIVQRLWDTGIQRLRLDVVELVRRIGHLLDAQQQYQLRTTVDSWLSDTDPFTNSLVFDALQGIGGPETDLSVESAHQEFIWALEMPRSQLASERAMHLYTCMFDHPCDSLYWEAFHERLTDAERRELLLRGADATYGDLTSPMIIAELARNPTSEAIPCLQKFALAPDLSGTWAQSAVETYLRSISALAGMGVSPNSRGSDSLNDSAWRVAALLLHYLAPRPDMMGDEQTAALWERLESCGVAKVFDVVMHVEKSFGFYEKEAKISFLPACSKGVRRLARIVLVPDYQPATEFRQHAHWHDLETEHRTFALQVLGEVGRKTDLKLVRTWTEDPALGKQAIATAKVLEASM